MSHKSKTRGRDEQARFGQKHDNKKTLLREPELLHISCDVQGHVFKTNSSPLTSQQASCNAHYLFHPFFENAAQLNLTKRFEHAR